MYDVVVGYSPVMITITAMNVSDINIISARFNLSLRKHIANKQTNSGVVLFRREIITMSTYFAATMFMRLLTVD